MIVANIIGYVKRRRWESNPLETALQAAAWPSGSSVRGKKCPRQESNLVYDLRRVACSPSHSKDVHISTPPRNRTPSCGSEDRRASITLAEHQHSVSRPGLEPGPGPSEGPMRSATPSGHQILQRADDWIRTSITSITRRMPFSIEPRRQSTAAAAARV